MYILVIYRKPDDIEYKDIETYPTLTELVVRAFALGAKVERSMNYNDIVDIEAYQEGNDE